MINLSARTNAGNTQENSIAEDRPLGLGPFKYGREALVQCNAGRAVAAGTAAHSRGERVLGCDYCSPRAVSSAVKAASVGSKAVPWLPKRSEPPRAVSACPATVRLACELMLAGKLQPSTSCACAGFTLHIQSCRTSGCDAWGINTQLSNAPLADAGDGAAQPFQPAKNLRLPGIVARDLKQCLYDDAAAVSIRDASSAQGVSRESIRC